MHGLSLLKFVAVAMLILANAFFVAAEFALVSIRDTRVEQMLAARVPGARAVRRLQRGPGRLAARCSARRDAVLAGPGLARRAAGRRRSHGLDWRAASRQRFTRNIAAVMLGFALITYFHVVVGELVPKALALRRAEALAVAVAPPMLVFMAIARPAVRLLKSRPPSSCAASIFRSRSAPRSTRPTN